MQSFTANIMAIARLAKIHGTLLRARLGNQRFICQALAGQSCYNICINADMTVSCNCQDFDGTGHIGNLNHQSLQDIFGGDIAQRFRRELAAGRFPTSACARCSELRSVSPTAAQSALTEWHVPTAGIMVENTSACNLHCRACQRHTLLGIRHKMMMSLDDIARVAHELAANDIKHVHFFNLGEPFLSSNIAEELMVLRRVNPNITLSISTNGILLDSDEKREAALHLDHIYFSIDGATQDSLVHYQRGGNFEKAYANLCSMVRYRDSRKQTKPIIEWKYVLFNWNDQPHLIQHAIHLAGESGADRLSFWPTAAPLYGISLRYYLGGFRHIGRAEWYGRVIVFEKKLM